MPVIGISHVNTTLFLQLLFCSPPSLLLTFQEGTFREESGLPC